jgi:hypothetical protein
MTDTKQSKPKTPNLNYSIEARAYAIVGVAAHDFWVLRDEKNTVLGQLHGLATNLNNKILPIGRFGDQLKFYHFGPRAILFGLNPDDDLNFIKANQNAIPVFAGNVDDVLSRWDNAVRALPYLNSLDVPYTPFGIVGLVSVNSNTAFTLFGQLMDLAVQPLPGYWQPGWRNVNKILTAAQLASMRYHPRDATPAV